MKKTVPTGRRVSKRARSRDLNAELLESIADVKAGRWARKTEFTRRADGSWRRRIVRSDGTVEKDEVTFAAFGRSSAMAEPRAELQGGFSYWVSDEQLRAYMALPLIERLRWVDEARRFTLAAQTPETRAHGALAQRRGNRVNQRPPATSHGSRVFLTPFSSRSLPHAPACHAGQILYSTQHSALRGPSPITDFQPFLLSPSSFRLAPPLSRSRVMGHRPGECSASCPGSL